jgi:hypothetical protein
MTSAARTLILTLVAYADAAARARAAFSALS